MNPNHPSSEDREPLADDGVDPKRLAEVEQRLKATRPRPAALDIEAIVRSADQTVILPEPSVERRGIRSYGWTIAIAGSWTCGAIAGALMTFLLLSQDAPPENSSDGRTAVHEGVPTTVEPSEEVASNDDAKQPVRDDTPQENAPPWSPSDSLVAVMLLDPYGRGAAPYGDGVSTLRAGDFARSQDASGSSRFRHHTSAMSQGRAHTSDPGGDTRQDITPDSAPASSITQEQLLKELLGTRPDSVL